MARYNDEDYEFNPIKEISGNKEAERVIWSTNSLNKAVDALKKGLPLKANPFMGKNTKLLKPDLVYRRTEEEIEDYIKCKKDPLYFASKCYLMSAEGGLMPCVLRDYQEDYLKHLQNHRFSILLACRQAGKCFSLLSSIIIKTKNISLFNDMLEKYYFYINNTYIFIKIPMFELYNLCCKQTLIWKCKYQLYKIIYKLTYGGKKRTKNIEET